MRPTDACAISAHPAGVPATPAHTGRDRKPRRWPKSPDDIHGAKVAKAKGRECDRAKTKRDAARAKLNRRECGRPWSDAIWFGNDRDYATGRLSGSGTAKVECCGCKRRTPPNSVSGGLCDDCIAASTVRRHERRRQADPAWTEDAAPTPVGRIDPGPAVPFTGALDAMAAAHEQLIEPELPSDDEAVLNAATNAYHAAIAGGSTEATALAEWRRATGTAQQQAYLRRKSAGYPPGNRETA